MAEATTNVEQLVDDYEEVWNGDFSKLDVVSESVAVHDPAAPGGELHGRDEFEGYVRGIHEGFPDFRLELGDWIGREDVVMSQWTATGTHEGEFAGIPPTERPVEITGMVKLVIADGKVREGRIYWDRQEWLEQLGLVDA